MKGQPSIPSTERSVRYGMHWAVSRQIDRVGRAIERNTNMGAQVGYLKNLCYPFWRDNESFKREWKRIKKKVSKELEDRPERERLAKLRQEQLNLLVGLLWDNEVLVDEGIPVDSIQALEQDMGDTDEG